MTLRLFTASHPRRMHPLPMFLILIIVPGCHRPIRSAGVTNQPDQSQRASTPASSPEIDQSVEDLIQTWPFIDDQRRRGMLRAWARVPSNLRFRVAKHSDFQNSFLTTDYGELAGASGLATMIMDKTAGSRKMSLIIFVDRPGNRSDLYWIYRDTDLSLYRLSRSSGDLLVEEPQPNGGSSTCEIEWDRSQRHWTCKRW
jgi:hypothetical protein